MNSARKLAYPSLPEQNSKLPRLLEVIAKRLITPNMLRVTLGGVGMNGFPNGQEGGYVKLHLPPLDTLTKPLVRTYTISEQREREIDLDFALHGETATGTAGPATDWATQTKPGDQIAVSGPGPSKPLPPDKRFYLVLGDMTSLPAIAVHLKNLAADAKGLVFLEVLSAKDRQYLRHPRQVQVQWVVNPDLGRASVLPKFVSNVDWMEDGIFVWCACEFSSMKAVRAQLTPLRAPSSDWLYISSYWKSGLTEDEHKKVKRDDAQMQ